MTLIVRDLLESKELDSKAMAAVRGGNDGLLPAIFNAPEFLSTVDQNQFAFANINDNDLVEVGKGGLNVDVNNITQILTQNGQAVS